MSAYKVPAEELLGLLREDTPGVAVSPAGADKVLAFELPSFLSLADVAGEEVRVAGLRFDPVLRASPRVRWSSWARIRLVRDVIEGNTPLVEIPIQVPPNTRMRGFEFSLDGKWIAFFVDGSKTHSGTQLWVADSTSGNAKKLLDHVSCVLAARRFQWLPGNMLLALVVPDSHTHPLPLRGRIPAGPLVKANAGGNQAPARTYADLLQTEHDERVFEHYGATHVVAVDALSGAWYRVLDGKPDLYASVDISPDGQFALVEQIARPYSRILPVHRFTREYYVVAFSLAAPTAPAPRRALFARVPVQEDMSISFDARPRGPRQIEFVWNRPHTLAFVESLDGGEPSHPPADADGTRDALFYVEGPGFDYASRTRVFAGKLRVDSVRWTHDADSGSDVMFVEESWYKDRQERMHVVSASSSCSPRLLYSRSSDDAYSSRGGMRTQFRASTGRWGVKSRPSDGAVIFFGEGASPNGSRPFVDVVSLPESGDALLPSPVRLWRSPAGPEVDLKQPEDVQHEVGQAAVSPAAREPVYQRPLDVIWAHTAPLFLGEDMVLVVHESRENPPNLMLVPMTANPSSSKSSGLRIPITQFPHPQPALRGVKKELIRYKRKDGTDLSAELFLPPNYSGEALPLLCWAYPTEFKSKEHASQVKVSPYRFIQTSWSHPLLWVVRGFAVLDDFSCPIVGEGDAEPNDTFIEQLTSSAEAAIAECVSRGVADPNRVACGGHSYGAFMTANLLCHTDLFKAGIARSGAYNRTLTPFGYQSEERNFWQAPLMYVRNSPFAHVDKMQAPLLLIHGADDNNSGTNVIQSERLYGAMQGLGKQAKLVILPCERHSYDAEESILHVVAEQDEFLMQHVASAVGQPSSSDVADPETKRARI